ncbi:MAG: dTDP-4-dehydrorhamnose reductase [Naasia sp.]|jgi:dTDP-4-dehydrorhamnose reductase|nr:dTDP-4-dehydrorhamnose reductase [Naasia sp.]
MPHLPSSPPFSDAPAAGGAVADLPRESRQRASLPGPGRLQLWGGVECTINRVGDAWSDQARFTGHHERAVEDIRRFEGLGIPLVRYPLLWEAVAPDSLEQPRFEVFDERMDVLRESRLEPILGLLHHGSGPHYTSLVDPAFPEKLAAYAAAVAERYPWVTYYTPVNEPLTTARFSGLYGVWYPHARDHATFARALVNQVRGTVLAMAEIRKVNPHAKLVATDDLGRATGTEQTRGQVDFENTRRWLSWDLLLGRVTPEHPLHDYLVQKGGLSVDELRELADSPCPPDILGINHYLLSNRFLDSETDWYPGFTHGPRDPENGLEYADVPALETARADSPPLEDILREVWERYGDLPYAVTEVHIDGDPGTQLQWLWEVWNAASRLRGEGAPLVAVTAWSLLGTYDWNTLCTTPPGGEVYYEPGVFDVRSGAVRATELTKMVRSLATTGTYRHPALEQEPWWRLESRFRYARELREELAS